MSEDRGELLRRINRCYELTEMFHSNRHEPVSRRRLIAGHIEYQFLSHYFGSVPAWRLGLRALNKHQRVRPDFALVGPIKGGSSDLVTHLLLHPCVMTPLVKEMHTGDPGKWPTFYPTRREQARIREKYGAARAGIFDPAIHSLRIMDGLRKTAPSAKIIISLRNPIDRAYSHWKWDKFLFGPKLKDVPYYKDFASYIDFATQLFPAFPCPSACGYPLLETGIYSKAVELWRDRFGVDNVMVFDVAEYFADRRQVLQRIQKFLELPIVEVPLAENPVNENPLRFPPMDEATRAKLRAFYQPFNDQLYGLLSRDLGWR